MTSEHAARPSVTAHPRCAEGHVCHRPSGRTCIEAGCDEPAGTLWGPLWCPEHDRQRLDRVSASLEALVSVENAPVACRWCGRDIQPHRLSSTGWTHAPLGGIACPGPGANGLLRFPDYLATPANETVAKGSS